MFEQDDSESRQKRLQSTIGRLATSRLGNFGIIGITLTVFGLVFIEVGHRFGWDADAANAAQAVISIFSNFLLNYYFTWSDMHMLSFRKHVSRFVIAKVGTLTVNIMLFAVAQFLFRSFFGEHWAIFSASSFAYLGSTGFITIANYPIMDDFVFGTGRWQDDMRLMFTDIFRLFTLRRMLKKVRE